VSGKSWKEAPSKRASADKNAIVNKHSSWEKKMQEKARKKAFQEQKAAALEAVKSKRKVGGNSTRRACPTAQSGRLGVQPTVAARMNDQAAT
jgi:hypothetical protein